MDAKLRHIAASTVPVLSIISAAVVLAFDGCADQPQVLLGEGCELTTDCAAPLVCRLGACREACREPRDCRPGTTCVRDPEGFGVCQLEREADCALTSDCPDGLVCRFGSCTNACMNDRDCISGFVCSAEEGETELGCHDPFEVECQVSSDCGDVLVCARDGKCREECRTDRDCRDNRICDATGGDRVCVLPNPLQRPPPPVTFAAGGATTCALDAAGTELRCFGRNTSGEAGFSPTSPSALPGNVLVGAPVVALAMGDRHGCAITDGLSCWGDGTDGQLGLGSTTVTALAPTAVPMGTDAVGVATGFAHTCAWSTTEMRCWGRNDRGQLGDGTFDTRFEANAPLERVSPVVHAAGGESHTCAVRDDGTLFCWGANESGQLGDDTVEIHATPTRALVSDVVEVALGRSHTCALRRDRQVRCWGDGRSGQTGDEELAVADGVIVPPGLGPVVQITAGATHTCVLEEGGVVKCFGDGSEGQVGAAGAVVATPTAVPLPGPAIEVRAGHFHTCVRLEDGSGYCFGANENGQFGVPGAGGPTPVVTSAL